MREIKCKAWHKRWKELEGVKEIGFCPDDGLPWEVISLGNTSYDVPEDAEILLYTGLKDKNGKEIYEGDIVSDGFREGKVLWDVAAFAIFDLEGNLKWGEKMPLDSEGVLEVIGNIYENPELMEG